MWIEKINRGTYNMACYTLELRGVKVKDIWYSKGKKYPACRSIFFDENGEKVAEYREDFGVLKIYHK